MIIESDYPRIVDAACVRLEASFDAKARGILIAAVQRACCVVGQELELADVLAGIYGCELRERALKNERDIESATPTSIRKRETEKWTGDSEYLEKVSLVHIVGKSDGLPRLVRCNMFTVFALIGYAIRISRPLPAGTVAA